MKKLFAIFVALVASLSMVSTAQAVNEEVTGTTEITSISGPLYQALPKPVNIEIHAEVIPPPANVTVDPMKNTKITFPEGVTFNPNEKVTPTCPDSKIGPATNLSLGPKALIDLCPKSVIGTGIAPLYLGKFQAAPLNDPVLIIFNAGKDGQGRAKIKIYGYSKQTTVGVLMYSTLKGRVLDTAIPVLSSDSAVKFYTLQIPGPVLDRPDLNIKIKGFDKNYARATCPASGVWKTNSVFELGQRDVSTGQPTSPTVTVDSPETTQDCTGLKGSAKLKGSVKGPSAVKKGAKGTFKVTIKNTGTGMANAVKVTATGGGKANAGNVTPGTSKTVTVKTKVNGRKGGKTKITFTIKGKGVSAKAVKTVRVK